MRLVVPHHLHHVSHGKLTPNPSLHKPHSPTHSLSPKTQLHTDAGDIKLEIFCEAVPQTAENFLALCASGAYNHTPIHRLIPGFILQTGSPATDPKSKSSVSIYTNTNNNTSTSPFFPDEIRPTLRHNARGVVSMANKGPNTNGSQFFITFAPAPHLDGRNTVFGRVIQGAGDDGDGDGDVLGRLERVEVDGKGRPRGRVVVKGVTVHANPLAG
ncbi:cyclophilin-like protein [Pseudovirgaria hyperparasitica]|uniref:Peptidyl-prolyl cis-trans isomerase n=1 Tax=Pseudovirgaria hyperparasitica TaxID=470096 RepID=A0A6A6WFV3_9PEZI|nr:cyclophilin-like protein [Pseudovirgaria hyperparasitica]KAF2761712.1 cyclophilin-like protein [Pseudovirgaria hyperparasitica]